MQNAQNLHKKSLIQCKITKNSSHKKYLITIQIFMIELTFREILKF